MAEHGDTPNVDLRPEQGVDEEEETCGFCIFMKGGGCKSEFTSWEKCVDQARQSEEDFTEGCREQTQALQQCMLDNSDYYAPLLEGTASALDAAEESSEDHQQTSGPSPDMGSDARPDDSPSTKPDVSSGQHLAEQPSQASGQEEQSPQAGPSQSKETASKPEKQHSASDASPPQHGEGKPTHQESSAGSKAAEPQQDASPGQQSDVKGGDAGEAAESSGDSSPLDLPHAGEEDKTGMPGEPEPEPEPEQEEEPGPPEVKVESAPFDVRFPGTNQARHCYTRYNEYHKCAAANGDDDERCSIFQRAYRAICPGEWVDRWNEQRENGTWPGRW